MPTEMPSDGMIREQRRQVIPPAGANTPRPAAPMTTHLITPSVVLLCVGIGILVQTQHIARRVGEAGRYLRRVDPYRLHDRPVVSYH